MKIIGKPQRYVFDEEGNVEVTFLITSYKYKELVKTLDKEKFYSIDLKVNKSKRSLEQNNLMWQIINDIAKVLNGGRCTSENEWDIYLQGLEDAGAKCDYILMLPQAEKTISEIEGIRAFKKLTEVREVNGKELAMYKIYYGSSKMTTEEMTNLIQTFLDMASKVGIDTDFYENIKG